MDNKLRIGDRIKCKDKEDMVNVSEKLADENIFTDFEYKNSDGEEECKLVVTGFMLDKTAVEELQENFCDNFCKYPHICGSQEDLEDKCNSCPLNMISEVNEHDA